MSAQDKQELRVQIAQMRAKKPESELLSAGVGIANHDWASLITGESIACYSSCAAEPRTNELRTKLTGLGKKIFLPIIRPDTQMLWGIDKPPYSQNKFGISEPQVSQFDLRRASAIILPAMCADESGIRLGRGAGYFDRALADVPSFQSGGPIRIALIFDEEFLASVPSDENDELVDLLVTPTRIIHCKS